MTVDSSALDRVLAEIDVRSGDTRRSSLGPGGLLALAPAMTTLGYVVSGEITTDADADDACTLDTRTGVSAPVRGPRTLLMGDAFLYTDAAASVLSSASGATVVTAELDMVWPATARALPRFVLVHEFSEREPAAAGLAAHLGPGRMDSARSGDPVICRAMMATVVLSVIRAWAAACAPAQWPALSVDPFLERIVRAVAEEPGREWTLESLASLGAMSRTVLAERFRAAFGTSPASFVTETRMRRAMEMLEAGASVTETSRALGYGSDEGFSRAFRRHTGMPPSQWRRRTVLAR
ncbi:AraC family transcriptional regulator [Microbacterium sp. SORGH_AS_0888]|uniref:helix-turn-helix transcriptional regulator n=1 Tax=Microbacterium sp. SORGH_AS_0888 TaxID=3041791 RepID=UPI00278644BB|nr:AraC family transcriptional regulator [Microbacterium sp. SORGH_AS_0888]MDQ1128343.1 AraC-like DNA-binding protein [Microbacterium sp. SORGH_AS_0888]